MRFCALMLLSILWAPLAQAEEGKVAIIGDSIFAFPFIKKIGKHLKDKIPMGIHDFSVNRAVLLKPNAWGFPPRSVIPEVYREKVKPHKGRYDILVFDGGGNDMLVHEDECASSGCPALLQDLSLRWQQFFKEAADDGFSRIVFLGYYHLRGKKAKLSDFMDSMAEEYQRICGLSPVPCTYVDPRARFSEHRGKRLIVWDGIHPSSEGARVLADLIAGAIQE